MGIFACFNVAGLLLTAFALPKLSVKGSDLKATKCEDLFGCFKMLADLRMLMLIPLFMGQAMAIGILMGDYTRVNAHFSFYDLDSCKCFYLYNTS